MSKNNSDIIDFSGIFRRYTAKWYWFVISVVCCCILGFLYSKTVKPQYEVKAHVYLSDSQGASKLLSGGLSGVSDLIGGNASAEDEVDIMMSHSVLKNVAKDMELNRMHIVKIMPMMHNLVYKNFPVDVMPDPSIDIDTLRSSILFQIHVDKKGAADVEMKVGKKEIVKEKDVNLPKVFATPYGKFNVMLTPDYKKGKEVNSKVIICNYDVTAENLRGQINAGLASKHSQIIELQMFTDNTDYAKALLNTIIDKYNSRSSGEQVEQTSATARFLNDRIAMVRGELNETEATIANYKKSEGIPDVQTTGSLVFEQMKETERKLQESEISLRMKRLTLDFVRASAKDGNPVPVQGDELIAGMIRQYNQMLMTRMRLAESAKENNPTLVSLDKQIAATRKNIIESLETNIEKEERLVAEQRNLYNNAMSKVSGIPSQEKTYRAIEREREIQEQIYLFLLQKQEETAIVLSNISPKGTIIDRAYSLNEDNSLSRNTILLLCIILGIAIPPMFMMALGFVRRKFSTREDIESRTDVPMLGEICLDKSGDNLVVKPGVYTSSAELFRLARTNLQFLMRDAADKVVLVTSTRAGEGKSFVAVNMAASMAIMGKRTLLIGMDIRKPRLADYLGVKPAHGLTEYLANPSIGVNDIILKNAVMENFDLIVAGPVPPNPAEMLASRQVDDLFDKLREMYDYIIIDAAPVGMVTDTFLINRLADATIYVVRANYTKLSDIDFADKLFEAKRLTNMSLLVNGTQGRASYGYGYGERK